MRGSSAAQPVVLLVDDDDDVRDLAASLLSRVGFHVIAACNGADAILRVRERGSRPDAIVLDMRMPIMDGPLFLEAQQREPLLAHVPVILHTGEVEVAEPPAPTVRALLRKPCSAERLIDAVRRVCEPDLRVAAATLASGTGAIAPFEAIVLEPQAEPVTLLAAHVPSLRPPSPPPDTEE
jgi:CheY-like chemotaxis protein